MATVLGVWLGFSKDKKRMANEDMRIFRTRPVAPQHASRASSITMLFPFERSSWARYRAMEAPVMPLPMITISASLGSSRVVLWPRRNSLGSLCQKDLLDSLVGRVARG